MTTLTHLGLLSIGGVDAKKFLQGQLTCNMDEITSREPRLGAHCNPQGRIISLFRIFILEDHYYLQMPRELILIAMQALKKYAVFFKVTLTDVSDQFKKLGCVENVLKSIDIQNGIPVIYPETSEKFLPHDLNLPMLNAVSFNKGCYTGQEIIARMQYRGKLKNHLYHTTINTTLSLTRGADIFSENKTCGNIVDFCQTDQNHFELLVTTSETNFKLISE